MVIFCNILHSRFHSEINCIPFCLTDTIIIVTTTHRRSSIDAVQRRVIISFFFLCKIHLLKDTHSHLRNPKRANHIRKELNTDASSHEAGLDVPQHIVHSWSHLARTVHMWIWSGLSMHQCVATKTALRIPSPHINQPSSGHFIGEKMRPHKSATRLVLLYINYNPYTLLAHECHLKERIQFCPCGNRTYMWLMVAAVDDWVNAMFRRCDERVVVVHRLECC